MSQSPSELLQAWIRRQVPEGSSTWFGEQLEKLKSDPSDRFLDIALGMVPRRLGKDDLAVSETDLNAAHSARPGWDPRGWSVDAGARILLLCSLDDDGEHFARRFSRLCQTADASEAIAFYCGLPLYPSPELLEAQAAEGLRTNMRAVFEAVAHNNPFPREQFSQNRWNHMVLKALFVDSELAPIQGLDERANPELARILVDYAHERWAAGRSVTPELWRCVGPFADSQETLSDLEKVAKSDEAAQQKAAALALSASPAPEAKRLLGEMHPAIVKAVAARQLTWDSLFG